MATAEMQKAFIDTISPIAVKVCKERGYGNAQVWTCVAQACCESNYGTSKLMKNANAFFGIKANRSWVQQAKYGGLVYNAGTKECYDGKTYTNITACFRAYYNMEDSVRDYFDLLEGQRYRDSLTKPTVKEAITVIKNGGYATSPTYINTICSFYEKYRTRIEGYKVDGSKPTIIPDIPTTNPEYKKGNVYTTQVNLYVRTSPEGAHVLFSELTKDGKKHGYDDGVGALLRKGTRITCQDVKVVHDQTWIKCPSGWICAVNNIGKVYIK